AGDNPTDFGSDPTRTVTWSLNDGSASNNIGTATSTISITTGPALALGSTVAAWLEHDPATTLSPTVSITDLDSATLASATVQITGGSFPGTSETLNATASGNITVSWDSSSESLIHTGSDTLANYQTVL